MIQLVMIQTSNINIKTDFQFNTFPSLVFERGSCLEVKDFFVPGSSLFTPGWELDVSETVRRLIRFFAEKKINI